MRGLARLGDRTYGICYHQDHEHPIEVGGTIISSSSDILTKSGASGLSRVGDTVLSDCNHFGYIITGDQTVFINNMNAARIGDEVDGNDPEGNYKATIITSSTDIFS